VNREEWLNIYKAGLNDLFAEQGAKIPERIRLSCGFPSRRIRTVTGQYWPDCTSTDRTHEIFISPFLDDSLEVADTLVHEIVHACVMTPGHRGAFKRLALAVGLTGKMASSVAGEKLKARLNTLIKEIGPYPHAKLINNKKPKGSRLLKLMCPLCEYPVRVTRRWLTEKGAPLCPCGLEMVESTAINSKVHFPLPIVAAGEDAAGSAINSEEQEVTSAA
jgi:hypothetical protein